MSWWKRLLGGKGAAGRETAAPLAETAAEAGAPVIGEDDPRIAAGHARLDACWRAIGAVDDDVIGYLINPMFQGAPAWPNTRQAYRVIRTEDSLILASDGLADPFVGTSMDDASGLGLEVFLETTGAQGRPFDDIRASGDFALIEMVAQNMAAHGGVAGLLDRMGVLSMALPLGGQAPEGWADENGDMGVLLGLPVPGREGRVALPFGPVRLVAATPLRPAELAAAAASGEARAALAADLAATPAGHRFDRARQRPR
ncbi:MAG: hypothetical protein R3D46_12250 [Defluviimonas denitrificans]